MPIIFAQSLLIFPAAITRGLQVRFEPGTFWYWITSRLTEMFQGGFTYVVMYVVLIVFFCYFWTVIQFNPKEMSINMRDYGSFIPGIRPGHRTAEYLESVMSRITLAGAAFLSLIAILPMIISGGFEINRGSCQFLWWHRSPYCCWCSLRFSAKNRISFNYETLWRFSWRYC